jgi:hypothetical protein
MRDRFVLLNKPKKIGHALRFIDFKNLIVKLAHIFGATGWGTAPMEIGSQYLFYAEIGISWVLVWEKILPLFSKEMLLN